MDLITLGQKLVNIGKAEGTELFMGKPDRWWEKPGPKWRCVNDHVSRHYLKSEARGGACCLECGEFVLLTFPEDEDGPLKGTDDEPGQDVG